MNLEDFKVLLAQDGLFSHSTASKLRRLTLLADLPSAERAALLLDAVGELPEVVEYLNIVRDSLQVALKIWALEAAMEHKERQNARGAK